MTIPKRRNPATPATSRDVAPAPADVVAAHELPQALTALEPGNVCVVAGSSIYHDHRCDTLLTALSAGKTITQIPATDVGKRTLCSACRKLGAGA